MRSRSSLNISAMYQIVFVILLLIIGEGEGALTRRCVTPLSTTKCLITWMAHFRVRSVKKIPGDPYESRIYKLEVIEPVKGLLKGEVVEKETPATKHGGLALRVGGEYVLSGIKSKLGQCGQMLRDEEINFKKMTEKQKQAFRNIDLSCPTSEPVEPEEDKLKEPEVDKPKEPEVHKLEEPEETKPEQPEVDEQEELEDCPAEEPEVVKPEQPEPVEPKLSDREVLLKVLEILEKLGQEASGLRTRLEGA
ncbi:hypothetical protein AB6A40_009619 [Gnathostoma spinigerum]|uniref:Uncharacterized protein n=1 Tax=Gnathostoma spinigerum TaxID=75299 RepID=A0ABD6ESH2_9BILA